MIKTEWKEVVSKTRKQVPIEGFCDVCKKKLEQNIPLGYDSDGNQRLYYNYFCVTTHHHDWGNDSIESYKYYDICSVECLQEFITTFWKKHFNVNNTHEMEIETCTRLEDSGNAC